jgi:hypothetical protein
VDLATAWHRIRRLNCHEVAAIDTRDITRQITQTCTFQRFRTTRELFLPQPLRPQATENDTNEASFEVDVPMTFL